MCSASVVRHSCIIDFDCFRHVYWLIVSFIYLFFILFRLHSTTIGIYSSITLIHLYAYKRFSIRTIRPQVQHTANCQYKIAFHLVRSVLLFTVFLSDENDFDYFCNLFLIRNKSTIQDAMCIWHSYISANIYISSKNPWTKWNRQLL